MFDVCVVGHVTRDVVRIGDGHRVMPGGTAWYLPLALKYLGGSVAVVTKVGADDEALLDGLKQRNIPVFAGESASTTTFVNTYIGGSGTRQQRVTGIASPFTVEDIGTVRARVFHLGPLTRNDIPFELVRTLAQQAKISLDAQGFLRSVGEGDESAGEVRLTDWDEKRAVLPLVSTLKTDEEEARLLSGEEDLEKIALKLASYGPEEIIITRGPEGSVVLSAGELHVIPAFDQGQIDEQMLARFQSDGGVFHGDASSDGRGLRWALTVVWIVHRADASGDRNQHACHRPAAPLPGRTWAGLRRTLAVASRELRRRVQAAVRVQGGH